MSPDSQVRTGSDDRPALEKLINVHVLFIDIVGFSKLKLTEQVPTIKRLEEVVRATSSFYLVATPTNDLVIRATGDGMALVFFTNVIPAIECAQEIAIALNRDAGSGTNIAKIPLRMGIHMGPVFKFKDINGELNVAGEGINTAQRVMDCGDEGHILLSESVVSQLNDGVWNTKLIDLGVVTVKHGQELHILSLVDDRIGNEALPIKVREARAQEAAAERAQRAALDRQFEQAKQENEHRWKNLQMAIAFVALIVCLFLIPYAPLPLVDAVSVTQFENLTQDPKIDALSTQLRSRIHQSLARAPELVIAEDRSDQKAKPRWVLKGSIFKDGEKLRLQTELWDERENKSLFTRTYSIDGDIPDAKHPFGGQGSGVAGSKLAAVDLASNVRTSLPSTGSWLSQHKDTYLDYLKGSEYLEFKTSEDLKTAEAFFSRATKLDPRFAWGNLGLAQYHITEGGLSEDPIKAGSRALAEMRVVFTDEELKKDLPLTARAYALRGMVRFWFQRNWRCAEHDFAKALANDPTLTTAHRWYAMYLLVDDKRAESKGQIDQAIKTDKNDPITNATLVQYYYFNQEYSAAKEESEKAILSSNTPIAYRYLGLILEESGLGNYDEAEIALKKASELTRDGVDDLAALGHLYAIWGRRGEANKIIETLNAKKEAAYVAPMAMAVIYVGMWERSTKDKNTPQAVEDKKRASQQLIEAAKGSDIRLSWLALDPRFKEFFDAKENFSLKESLWKQAKLDQLAGNARRPLKADDDARCEEY